MLSEYGHGDKSHEPQDQTSLQKSGRLAHLSYQPFGLMYGHPGKGFNGQFVAYGFYAFWIPCFYFNLGAVVGHQIDYTSQQSKGMDRQERSNYLGPSFSYGATWRLQALSFDLQYETSLRKHMQEGHHTQTTVGESVSAVLGYNLIK